MPETPDPRHVKNAGAGFNVLVDDLEGFQAVWPTSQRNFCLNTCNLLIDIVVSYVVRVSM